MEIFSLLAVCLSVCLFSRFVCAKAQDWEFRAKLDVRVLKVRSGLSVEDRTHTWSEVGYIVDCLSMS